VLGVPCNQFGQQEPGSPEEIATFCSITYGVTFPMTEKIDVNGPQRMRFTSSSRPEPTSRARRGRPVELREIPGQPGRRHRGRFRPQVVPDADEVVTAVESVLPA